MKIIIRYENKSKDLQVDPKVKIKDMQIEIARITHLPPDRQQLSYLNSGHKVLLPISSKLYLYNIKDGSIIYVEEKSIENPQTPSQNSLLGMSRGSMIFEEDELARYDSDAILTVKRRHRGSLGAENFTSYQNQWIAQLIIPCREGNVEGLVDVLQSYQAYKGALLREEDVGELLNSKYDEQWSCIHYACYMGHEGVLKELIDLGADCNNVTSDQWTPLQISAYQGNIKCVELLLAHPLIEINKMTQNRGSALHLAVLKGHIEIVKTLMEHRAKLTIEDPDGKTPLELVTRKDIAELIPKYLGAEMLEKFGKPAVDEPLSFSGEVHYENSDELSQTVFLVLSTQNGKLSHFTSRQWFSEEKNPEFSIPFLEMKLIRYENKNDKYYFGIRRDSMKMKYYTNYEDMSNEWIKKIKHFIQYYNPNEQNSWKHLLVDGDENDGLFDTLENSAANKSQFAVMAELGSGSFGNVYKVKHKETGHLYAMKALNKDMLSVRGQLKYAISECKIMKAIKHPFILTLHWAFQSRNYLYMILELCIMDFSRLIRFYTKFNIAVSKRCIAEIILAIEYLHNLDIVYRDLKPQNILIGTDGHIKLADFGLAKEKIDDKHIAMSFCGSPAYMPPEIIRNQGCNKSADIYTIGANLYEMLTGKPPFYTENIAELYARIDSAPLEFPEGFDTDAESLIEMAMNRNPEQRPTIQQLKIHPFFDEIEWHEVFLGHYLPMNIEDIKRVS